MRCTPWVINGDAWCEPCTNELIDETKPRWVVGLIVLTVSMGIAWYLVGDALNDALRGVRSLRSVRLHIASLVVPFGVAWGVTFPIFAGERPNIERRRVPPDDVP